MDNFTVMLRSLFFLLFCFATFQASSQTTVNRKIGQRYDDHVNSTWEGKDSIVFNYNAFGIESDRLALHGQAGNNWTNFYRSTLSYDANQNLTQQIRENWINNTWQNSTKYNYTYNANNQETDLVYQVWNTSTNTWGNTGRIVSTYSNSNLTKIETFTWNGSFWDALSKQEMTYNVANELITKEFYNFNNNVWDKQERRQYQYSFGFVSSLIRSYNDNGNWLIKTRTLSAINGSATPPHIASVSEQVRDTTNSIWVDSSRITYNYTNNNLSLVELERYYPATANWNFISTTAYTYNTSNQVTEEEYKTYNTTTSSFDNNQRKLFTYNGNNLKDQITIYANNGPNNWIEDRRENYSYNANDSLIHLLVEDYVNNFFVLDDQYFYHYANVPVGLSNINNLFRQAKLFPNPATNSIEILTDEKITGSLNARIFSTEGKIVWEQLTTTLVPTYKFDIASLPSGHYFLQLIELSTGKTQHFKFTKN